MQIRLARDEDYAAMARLHRQTIRKVNARDYSPEQIAVWSGRTSARRFRESAAKCKRWAAVVEGKIVGFCDHNFECELWGLYVHKDYIGRGVGSRLIKVAEDSMRKQGCREITVTATITARPFYEKQGYVVVEQKMQPMDGIEVEAFVMRKGI